MPLTALVNNNRVYADECYDRNTDYRCVGCGEKMILARGQYRIPYFRHAQGACEFAGESEEHMNAKIWIYRMLKKNPKVAWCEAECLKWDGVRPDVAYQLTKGGEPIGIEIQRSRISVDEVIARNQIYQKYNVTVLWICTESAYKKLIDSNGSYINISKLGAYFHKIHNSLVVFTGSSILSFKMWSNWLNGPVYSKEEGEEYKNKNPFKVFGIVETDLTKVFRRVQPLKENVRSESGNYFKWSFDNIWSVYPGSDWFSYGEYIEKIRSREAKGGMPSGND